MKHPLLIITLLSVLSIQSSAQDNSFHLKNYKYRTPGFKALQVNVNGNGNWYGAKRINDVDLKDYEVSSNFGLSYFKIISSEKRQHLSGILVLPTFNYTKNVSGTNEQKNRSFRLDGNWQRIDRFFNQKNFFFELGNELQVGGSRYKRKSSFYDYRENNNNISDMLILGVGKGRLENVQDAQMAEFVVNDLRRLRLLNREPEAETMYELAALITDINNRRVFDNRIRRIYELTRIDSFFQTKQLIATTSIAYFTSVNDNWALAFNPGRLSGTRLYAQLKPGIGFNKYRLHHSDTILPLYKTDSKTTTYFYEPEIGIEYQKPVDLHWQRTATASLRFRQTFERAIIKNELSSGTGEFETFKTYPELLFGAFYGVGYYPNNRTVVNAGLNVEAIYGNWGNSNPDYYILSPSVQMNASYFINYRTRLFISAELNYRHTEIEKQALSLTVYDKNLLTGNVSFGLTHFIF